MCLQPDGQRQARHRRPARAGRRSQDRRQRRSAGKRRRMLKEYYKRPDATAEVDRSPTAISTPATPASSTRDGHLKIIDRAKDVGKLADGAMFAPQLHREQAQVLLRTSRKRSLRRRRATWSAPSSTSTCEAVGNWAERRGLAYSGYTDLAAKPEVYELMRECVEQVNAELAARSPARGLAGPPLPDPAQGARPGRRRADAHAQGAPRLRRREVRAC